MHKLEKITADGEQSAIFEPVQESKQAPPPPPSMARVPLNAVLNLLLLHRGMKHDAHTASARSSLDSNSDIRSARKVGAT